MVVGLERVMRGNQGAPGAEERGAAGAHWLRCATWCRGQGLV